MVGVSLEGLITIVLPATSAASAHAGHNRQREIPRRNHDARAQRQIEHFVVLAGHLHGRFRRRELLHLPRVILREIDRFADVSLGFGPRLAGFEHQPGVEIELAFADQRRRADHQVDAPLRRVRGSTR